MSDLSSPRLNKWPFFASDLVLVGAGALVLYHASPALGIWPVLAGLAAISAGAWLGVLPFIREYQAAVQLSEAEGLATAVSQIGNLERVQNQIAAATSQWEAVQQHSAQSVNAAREITDRMKNELTQLCAFLQKAQDTEKNHLRLEIEKLHRSERDWLQATVLVLDHVFALHAAGSRSGQPALVTQLNQFQSACRDAVRRVGLTGFAPKPDEPFDPQVHQLAPGMADPVGPMQVKQILALGYTYQNEVVRRALVQAEPVPAA
jgi:molecular chaperone GrpE (heat shock protein)